MDVYFDVYRKSSFFSKRTPVLFDEQKVFVPTKQIEIFKVLATEDKEVKKCLSNNGFICLTGLREDVHIKLSLNGDKLIFSLNREPVSSLGIIDLHFY